MISSTKNPKIIALRKLSQRKHRRDQRRFMVEGLQAIGLALETGHQPLQVFYCQEHLISQIGHLLLADLAARQGELQAISPKVMASLSERDTPQGLIVTFALFQTSLIDIAPVHPSLIIILDRLQDPGNLGTLIRTADAVGAQGVILLEPCADLFDPKTVRSTMGSIFSLPLVSCDSPETLAQQLTHKGYVLTGADGYQGTLPWVEEQRVLLGSTALVLGNEARGLSPDLRPHLSRWVRLPLRGQAESLNVAVAGGILMYQWLQINGLS